MLAACDPGKGASSETEPARAEEEGKPEAGEAAGAAPAPDLHEICQRHVELVAMVQAERKGGPTPPEGWEKAYQERCEEDLGEEVETYGAAPFATYERCMAGVKTLEDWGPCQEQLGLDKEAAKLAAQKRAPLPKGDDVCKPRLPRARRGIASAPGPDVRVTSQAVCIGDRPVVAILDGKVDPSAVEHHEIGILKVELKRILPEVVEEGDGPVVVRSEDGGLPNHAVRLSVDVDVEVAAFLDVLFTLQRAEANNYWLAMEATDGSGTSHHLLSGPRFLGLSQQSVRSLELFAFNDELRIMSGGETQLATVPNPEALRKKGARELPALSDLQAELKKAAEGDEELATIKIRADAYQPFRVVAALVIAAAGPDCPLEQPRSTWTREHCFASRIEFGG